MEKEKQSAKPQEVECPRPDLYCTQTTLEPWPHNGIWLWTGRVKILVRPTTDNKYLITGNSNEIGYAEPNPPVGPKYTGPIDDETMANILIYG